MKKLVLLATVTIFFFGCSARKTTNNAPNYLSKESVNTQYADADFALKENYVMESEEKSVYSSTDIPTEKIERKLIRNGNLSFQVENFADAEKQIYSWVESYGGYISSSDIYNRSANYTAKIPSKNFDAAMFSIGNLGKLKNKSISSDDVTDEYYDLESRLKTKEILKSRYETYLSKAKETKEILEIESQLNRTITEIESMKGRLKRLNDQVDYSTIRISIELPYGQNDEQIPQVTIGDKFKEIGSNFVNFMGNLLIIICCVIIFGIPIVLLIALFYWLLFGKIGLLKKLFKKLSGKK